jgi:hypothetical protein
MKRFILVFGILYFNLSNTDYTMTMDTTSTTTKCSPRFKQILELINSDMENNG